MNHKTILVACILLTAVTASAQQVTTPATSGPKDPALALQGLSVVLVLGEQQSGTSSDTMPAAARAALADMKDFLPYKSYRLLDSAWILSSSNRPSTSRLRGPDDQDYEVSVTARVFGTRVEVRFLLRDPGAEGRDGGDLRRQQLTQELAAIQAQRQSLEVDLNTVREKLGPRHPDVQRRERELGEMRKRIADLELHGRGGSGTIIDTGFTMEVGETVVVGTSRVRGDKALIALLTAVARKR